jgi:hypothetical protein
VSLSGLKKGPVKVKVKAKRLTGATTVTTATIR